MTTVEIERKLTDDVARIRDAIGAITGLQSRWNGSVQVDEFIGDAQAAFRIDGTIAVHPRLIFRKARWRTLIHEICHSIGVPVKRTEYDGAKGWEEGVVEVLQRATRPAVMHRLGILYDEEHIRRVEEAWIFQPYFEAIEQIYYLLKVEPISFSVMLLQQSLPTRVGFVIRAAPRQAMLLSPYFGVLKNNIPFGTMTAEERALLEDEETEP